MITYETIKERYGKHYIRADQMERYVALGIITGEQSDAIQRECDALVSESGGGGLLESIAAVRMRGSPANDVTIRLPGNLQLILRDGGEVGV